MITGYRVWRVRDLALYPVSTFPNTAWTPDVAARCLWTRYHLPGSSHHPPVYGCDCGYYSRLKPNEHLFSTYLESRSVVAKVKVYGKSIPYEDGYRSRYIAPLEFYVATAGIRDDDFQQLAQRHNVPLFPLASIRERVS